jgi:hypothetical protein
MVRRTVETEIQKGLERNVGERREEDKGTKGIKKRMKGE